MDCLKVPLSENKPRKTGAIFELIDFLYTIFFILCMCVYDDNFIRYKRQLNKLEIVSSSQTIYFYWCAVVCPNL